MAKNANGEGSIYKRMRDGKLVRYEGAISYVGDDGKTKRHTVYGRTRQDVRDKLREARERLEAGAPVRDATRTVGDWLAQWRATTLAASDRKESTRALYATLCRKHLEPAPFGAIPLDRLKPTDVEALVLAMRAKTKPAKTENAEPVRALSDSTIRQTYTILRAGLDGAVRDGLLARNPAALIKRPGIERAEAKHLDGDGVTAVLRAGLDGAVRDGLLARNPAALIKRPGIERAEAKHLDGDGVTAVLRAAEPSRYHPALVLIAATGLREGEALALRWDRVDLDAGTLKVSATISRVDHKLIITEPKTARSRRTVPMPSAVVSMLRKHRTAQMAERLRAGNLWTDSGLVFTTEFGAPVDPRNLLRVMEVAAKAAGVDGAGVHTLRHSAAVDWLESEVHIKAVADLLGHSSIAITGDVYGHTSDDTARSAVDGRAGRLGL